MSDVHLKNIALELGVGEGQVRATAGLLAEGGTVPFIARYRKEATGGLDEVMVLAVRDRLKSLGELDERREAMLKSLRERELLTPELEKKIVEASTMTKLEDVYLPHRPKKRTRAMAAKERGLAPLAERLFLQDPGDDPEAMAGKALEDGAQVESAALALAGARDILAEKFAEDEEARLRLRRLFHDKGLVTSRVKAGLEEKAGKYSAYFEFSERLSEIPSHRYLAIRRGESEGCLTMQVQPDPGEALAVLRPLFVKNDSPSAREVETALADGYKRLLGLSMETEARLAAKKKADGEAIVIFQKNLHELLMAPPLGGKPVLALDPGFRTGCKTAALSADGSLLEHATIQPHASAGERKTAAKKVLDMVGAHGVLAVAVGNGTAGRETMAFLKEIEGFPKGVPLVQINESGASVYSASELAREEFPDLDLTVRGAVSIGRRLMDPLAELVKIDPKSIGVGQYQHDVDQARLKSSLDDVVESCVSNVGVEANTASEKLLSYVAGLGPSLARNIVKYRQEHGPFKTRKEFLKVPRLGPKAFEQCAGFLRLAGGDNPLDASAVHPESYKVVEGMAGSLNVSVGELMRDKTLRDKINPADHVTEKTGLPTIRDILDELEKPGRDPRESFSPTVFTEGADDIKDLAVGQQLNGVVTNVAAFGAFVDVGVHTNGLVHISEMSNKKYVKVATDEVSVGQGVTVWVKSLDPARNRLGLTMKGPLGQEEIDAAGQSPPRTGGGGGGRGGQGGGRPGDPRPGGRSEPQKPAPAANNPFGALKKLL
ncbi:MAG: RNA-binding transcriptional accessory protein [Deltaproteobacteria bacterium]|jgi:uncharacterized protein|nr:RNA-binding transcriptional accessory protein [Deltaproteobacteria bacterium]